jgi:hypothetical protein
MTPREEKDVKYICALAGFLIGWWATWAMMHL